MRSIIWFKLDEIRKRFIPFLLLVIFSFSSGCAHDSSEPILPNENYVVSQDGRSLFVVEGGQEGWRTVPENHAWGRFQMLSPRGANYTGETWRIFLMPESSIWRIHYLNMLLYDDYQGHVDFLRGIAAGEHGSEGMHFDKYRANTLSLWGLKCIRRSGVRGRSDRFSSISDRIVCPVILDGRLWELSLRHHWSISLTGDVSKEQIPSFEERLDSSLDRIRPTLNNVEFLVDLSQDSDDLTIETPRVPEGMTYLEFYLNYIPRYFQITIPAGVGATRKANIEDVELVKSSGMTLEMAKQWKAFAQYIYDVNAEGKEPEEIVEFNAPAEFLDLFTRVVENWDKVK